MDAYLHEDGDKDELPREASKLLEVCPNYAALGV